MINQAAQMAPIFMRCLYIYAECIIVNYESSKERSYICVYMYAAVAAKWLMH